jgi:hypothetical protein
MPAITAALNGQTGELLRELVLAPPGTPTPRRPAKAKQTEPMGSGRRGPSPLLYFSAVRPPEPGLWVMRRTTGIQRARPRSVRADQPGPAPEGVATLPGQDLAAGRGGRTAIARSSWSRPACLRAGRAAAGENASRCRPAAFRAGRGVGVTHQRLACSQRVPYSSSVTCASQVTTSPSASASWMATCAMKRSGVAPCQCSSPGSM